MWMWPVVPAPATYSLASTPMRRGKHSSESAAPVEIAISGRLPSVLFRGRRSDLAGCGLSLHDVTVGKLYSMRHLPVCSTRGTFFPHGPSGIVKCPVASVTVLARMGG